MSNKSARGLPPEDLKGKEYTGSTGVRLRMDADRGGDDTGAQVRRQAAPREGECESSRFVRMERPGTRICVHRHGIFEGGHYCCGW